MVQIIKFGVKINYFVVVVEWWGVVSSPCYLHHQPSWLNIIKLSSRPIYDKIATAGLCLFYWSELTRTESRSLIDIWMHFSCVSPLVPCSSLCSILMVFTAEHKYRIKRPHCPISLPWQHTCIPVLLMSHGQGSALETFSHTNTQSENLQKSISPIFCWKQQPASQLSWEL